MEIINTVLSIITHLFLNNPTALTSLAISAAVLFIFLSFQSLYKQQKS